MFKRAFFSGFLTLALLPAAVFAEGAPKVAVKTNLGDFVITLEAEKAPISTENFVGYVKDGFYNGTIFHRVIGSFMIQGGGFAPGMKKKETKAPIKNEADNGLKNNIGTLAMARTRNVNSATSQFFINVADNEFLNHGVRDFGYAVFGKVTEGMETIEKIKAAPTGSSPPFRDVPKTPIIIESMTLMPTE